MAWFRRKLRKTYHSIGWTTDRPERGVFRDVALPGGAAMRVMDKGVHQAALECAERKLRELAHRSGKKEHF